MANAGRSLNCKSSAQVLAHGDVVGRAGIENHKRTQAKPTRQSDRAPHKHPVPDIKGSSPVVEAQIVLIRWKAPGAEASLLA